jgi:hypothetical protein
MTKFIKSALTSKWLLVVQEYELVKQGQSPNFKTVGQICDAFKVHRKDIRKYYERWIKSGKNADALWLTERGGMCQGKKQNGLTTDWILIITCVKNPGPEDLALICPRKP